MIEIYIFRAIVGFIVKTGVGWWNETAEERFRVKNDTFGDRAATWRLAGGNKNRWRCFQQQLRWIFGNSHLCTLLSLVSIGIKLAKQSGSGQLQKGCKVINLKPRQVFLSCPERARPWVALDGPYHGRATLHTFVIRSDFAKLFCTKNHLHVVDWATWHECNPPEGKKLLNLKIYFNMEFMESNGWGSVAIDWI